MLSGTFYLIFTFYFIYINTKIFENVMKGAEIFTFYFIYINTNEYISIKFNKTHIYILLYLY